MRLQNQKKSTNLVDNLWKTVMDKFYFPSGDVYSTPNTDDSYINNKYGDMSEDEIKMVKSGADYRDIMFMRAMRNSGTLFEPRGK